MIYVAMQKTYDPPLDGPFLVKIGYAQDVFVRLATQCADPIVVLPGDRKAERDWHREFAGQRRPDIGREWFELSREQLASLVAIETDPIYADYEIPTDATLSSLVLDAIEMETHRRRFARTVRRPPKHLRRKSSLARCVLAGLSGAPS